MGMENEKHERPVSEAAVFCLEQYVCEMALATSSCKTKPSHNVSKWPKYQRRFLFAILDVGDGRRICGVGGGGDAAWEEEMRRERRDRIGKTEAVLESNWR